MTRPKCLERYLGFFRKVGTLLPYERSGVGVATSRPARPSSSIASIHTYSRRPLSICSQIRAEKPSLNQRQESFIGSTHRHRPLPSHSGLISKEANPYIPKEGADHLQFSMRVPQLWPVNPSKQLQTPVAVLQLPLFEHST